MANRKKQKKTSKKLRVAKKQHLPQDTVTERKSNKSKSIQQSENTNWILVGFSAAGMILTAYLVYSGLLNKAPILCTEGSSCDIVQQSRWGTFLGMPTAFWGFLTYASLFYIIVRVHNTKTRWKAAWVVSLAGWGYSAYLIAISTFVIQALCIYCIASFSIMSVLFGVTTFKRPKESDKFKFFPFASQFAIVALVFVGGMHMHYSGLFDPNAGPEDPWLKGLTQHLQQEKAVLYGAYW